MEKKFNLKKLIATGAVVTSLAMCALPTEALAHVEPSDILGDEQYVEMYNETRDSVKQTETEALKQYFRGYDDYGCETTTLDDVCKAKELSDLLASYDDQEFRYTNCTPSEIMNLDINGLYNEYLDAVNNGTLYYFMMDNLTNKPAIDAYLNFAGLAVSNHIKDNLAIMIYTCVTNQGQNVTKYPTIQIRNRQIYAVLEIDGFAQVIEITGQTAKDLETSCSYLDARTNKICQNIEGSSKEYPQGIAYNGVSNATNESAYLSLPDDQYKKVIVNSAAYAESTKDFNNYEFYVEDPSIGYNLNVNEVELLYNMGYSTDMVNSAILRYAGVDPVKTYTK